MSRQPAVTVLMSVFNGLPFLAKAVESIIKQTFEDFEFLVIDDCSTDGSSNFLASIQDSRLRVVQNEENVGQTISLNKGIKLSRGKYIARMDADDIAHPERLEKQVQFLENHPNIGILGTSICLIDAKHERKIEVHNLPKHDLCIRWLSLLQTPFMHPTVMIRRDVLQKNNLAYNPAFVVAQDYQLWTQLLQYTQGANLDEPLLKYRIHPESLSAKNKTLKFREHDAIARDTIRNQLPQIVLTEEEVSQLRAIFAGGEKLFPITQTKYKFLVTTYLDMYRIFVRVQKPEGESLEQLNYLVSLPLAISGFRVTPQVHSLQSFFKAFALSPKVSLLIVQFIIKHINLRLKRYLAQMFLW